ncbi:MAG: hypothetical protein ACK559_09330, partial [bacterium]
LQRRLDLHPPLHLAPQPPVLPQHGAAAPPAQPDAQPDDDEAAEHAHRHPLVPARVHPDPHRRDGARGAAEVEALQLKAVRPRRQGRDLGHLRGRRGGPGGAG